MKSHHTLPPEKMKITFHRLKIVTAMVLHDNANLVVSGMETDVVNQIISNSDIVEEILCVCKREKHVKSGLIDLFCYDKDYVPVVIEVKRSLADISAV